MYYEKIINIQTNEEIIREYTDEEKAEVEKNILKNKEELKILNEQQEQRKAILKKIGLTEEEILLFI